MPTAAEIEGKWLLGINTKEYVGADTLTFRNDGLFIDTKSVRYSDSDSGFDFSVHMSTYMEGEWYLKNDTLNIVYAIEKPEIIFDKQSFKIAASENNADCETLGQLNDEMYNCLCENLRKVIYSNYTNLSSDTVRLGRIISISDMKISMESSDGCVTLVRIE